MTCIREEKIEESRRSQARQSNQNDGNPPPLGENVRKHVMRVQVTDFRVRGGGRGRGRGKGRGRFRGRWGV